MNEMLERMIQMNLEQYGAGGRMIRAGLLSADLAFRAGQEALQEPDAERRARLMSVAAQHNENARIFLDEAERIGCGGEGVIQ